MANGAVLASQACCGCNGRDYAEHMVRQQERRTEALNREFILLSCAAVLSFALTLIGILGLTHVVMFPGDVAFVVLGSAALFGTFLWGSFHLCKRASNNEVFNLVRDTLSFNGGGGQEFS